MNKEGSRPLNFWELKEDHLLEWRQHPVTASLLQALQADMDNGLKTCAELSASGEVARSAAASGNAWEAERILKGIVVRREERPPEAQDTTFVDRATRLSTRTTTRAT